MRNERLTGSASLGTHPAISVFTLEGTHVRLEPLRPEHAAQLWAIARDHRRELFRWVPYRLESLENFREFNAFVLREQARGVSVPFATFLRSGGQLVGTTRFMNMDLGNRKVEIGS